MEVIFLILKLSVCKVIIDEDFILKFTISQDLLKCYRMGYVNKKHLPYNCITGGNQRDPSLWNNLVLNL